MNARRPAWWGGVAVAVLCAGGLAWWWLGSGRGPAVVGASAPVPAAGHVALPVAAPAADSAAVRPVAVAASAPASAVLTASSSAAPAAALPRDPARAEVCGHGRLLPQDFERLYPQQVLWDQRQRLNDQLLRGDARQQALGWLLSQALVVDRAAVGPTCGADDACVRRIQASVAPQIGRATSALVELALNSPDPWLYAIAASYGCAYGFGSDGSPGATACARLNPADWQRRAPGDAAPWLWQADLAGQRGDDAAARVALERAGEQRTFTSAWMQLLAPLQGFAPWRDADPVLRMTVLKDVMAASLPLEGTASTADCELEPPGDPKHQAACDAAMRLFSSDGATLVHQGVAGDIARQRGAPAERVQALDDFRKSALAHQAKVVAVQNEGMSCAAIAATEKHLAAVVARGEVGAVRQALRDSERAAAASRPN